MAANVGKLNVLVAANISALKANLATASQTVGKFATKVGQIGAEAATKIAKFATASVAVGAGAVTVGLVKASSAMDDIAKKADTLGIGTEELVKLRHAGNLAGVGAEELDTGLGKMLKTIGEAAIGIPAATDAIEGLGLSVSDLQGLNADQQFGKIADAIMSFQDPAQRAAAAANIFGRGFMQMMPLLTSGSKGIKAAGDEAERLGMTFSRFDAAKVEGMNDAFTKLTSSLQGVFQKIAVQIAPTLESAFGAGADAVGNLGDSIATFVDDAINQLLFLVKTWKQQWELLKIDTKEAVVDMANDANPGIAIQKALPEWRGLIHLFDEPKEKPLGGTPEETRKQVLLRDITAEREAWEKLREAKKLGPAKDESAFFKDFKAAATDESAFFGKDASRVELMLGRATKVLDLAKDESAFFQDMPTPSATPLGLSTQAAAAAQIGTSEAASMILASMRAVTGAGPEQDARETAINTRESARSLEKIAKRDPIKVDVISSFV